MNLLARTLFAASGLVTAGFGSTAAHAQAAAPVGLEEVVVTARRVEENLQSIPVAVTAFTAADIRNQAMANITDLQHQTPSLSMERSATGPMAPLIQMRGQTQSTFQFSQDPTIGIYVDGVYNTATFGIQGQGLLDMERVEILKGPQGTLYGKNTTGGAISFYTRLPADVFEGEVTAGIGDYSRRLLSGVVNAPLGDKAALRLAASYSEHGGYGRNLTLDRPLNDAEDRNLRATLKLNPTEDLEIIVRGDAGRSKMSGVLNVPVYFAPNSPVVRELAVARFGSASAPALAQALGLLEAQAAASRANPYRVRHDDPTEYALSEVAGGSVTMSYNLGSAVLKSITAYRSARDERVLDLDGTDLVNTALRGYTKINQTTQELQLSGSALGDRLSYTTGVFYYRTVAGDYGLSTRFPFTNPNSIALQIPRIRGESPAIYGQGTFELLPNLKLTAGLRWTRETKKLKVAGLVGNGAAFNCILGPTVNPCVLNFRYSDSNISYNFAADWSVTPDVLVYVKTSRGYKSGFINQAAGLSPATQAPVLPERATDYELGLKSEWLDRRLRVNAAYFHTDYANIQRTAQVTINGVGARVATNAAKATIDGVEFEATALPISGLRIGVNAAYTEPQYENFLDNGFDQSGQRFLGVSKWKYGVAISYDHPVSFGTLHAAADWTWRSNVDMSPADGPGTLAGAAPGPGTPDRFRIQPSYGLLNASAGVTFERWDADLRVFVKNVTDEKYYSFIIGLVNSGFGFANATPGDPRTFGVDLTLRF